MKVAKGFRVELLYSVPKDTQGFVGLHVCRSEGPADCVGPVRCDLPRHAPPVGTKGRSNSDWKSFRARSASALQGYSGRSTRCTLW